jgi:hypothetical protein
LSSRDSNKQITNSNNKNNNSNLNFKSNSINKKPENSYINPNPNYNSNSNSNSNSNTKNVVKNFLQNSSANFNPKDFDFTSDIENTYEKINKISSIFFYNLFILF